MTFKKATIFSNGSEYEIFKDNYCYNKCKYHKEREDGFPEFTENGGCPIEDGIENARFHTEEFPNVLVEVWDKNKCVNWHFCPFYTRSDTEK